MAATGIRALIALLLEAAITASSPTLTFGEPGDRLASLALPVVAACGVWMTAPGWAAWIEARAPEWAARPAISRRAACVLVGTAAIALPLALIAAAWVLVALRVMLTATWDEARMFVEPSYYAFLIVRDGPMVLAGAVLLAIARHVAEPNLPA